MNLCFPLEGGRASSSDLKSSPEVAQVALVAKWRELDGYQSHTLRELRLVTQNCWNGRSAWRMSEVKEDCAANAAFALAGFDQNVNGNLASTT